MLTFLELYQTLLGFVFFKLYADAGLVYPPPLDTKKDENGAGVDAFSLQEAKTTTESRAKQETKEVEVGGKRISSKDVRQTIKMISSGTTNDADVDMSAADDALPDETAEEDFVIRPSTSDPNESTALPTYHALSTLPASSSSRLFSPYTFWLSRETSRPIFEFLVRSFGGRIGWPATSGSGSPFEESDDSITHVIIDRPTVQKAAENETEEERQRRQRRKYVQPQWVVDCINAGQILLEDSYAQGKTLPPHLSPFEDHPDAYNPVQDGSDAEMDDPIAEDVEADESEDEAEKSSRATAVLKAAATAEDAATLRAAELEAEVAGIDYGSFEKEAKKARKTANVTEDSTAEDDMNKMMMSNKQRKLYERMKYGEKKRAAEVRS